MEVQVFGLIFWGIVIYLIYRYVKKRRRLEHGVPILAEMDVKTGTEGQAKLPEKVEVETLHTSQIMERDAFTFGGMSGHGEKFMDNIARRVQGDDIPDVVVSRRELIMQGDDKPLPFVVVSNTSAMLRAYDVFIHASDYGSRLRILWFVRFDIQDKITHGYRMKEGQTLQEFWDYKRSMAEDEALASYIGVIRGLFDAEQKVMFGGGNFDSTKEDAASRGFGNLS